MFMPAAGEIRKIVEVADVNFEHELDAVLEHVDLGDVDESE